MFNWICLRTGLFRRKPPGEKAKQNEKFLTMFVYACKRKKMYLEISQEKMNSLIAMIAGLKYKFLAWVIVF